MTHVDSCLQNSTRGKASPNRHMPFVVKLKKANAPTVVARFDARPSWGDLTSTIAEQFEISLNNVGVVFIDEAKEAHIITEEQYLQSFYEVFNPPEKIKFVVQDLQTPDRESASNRLSLLPIIHHSISQNHNHFHLVSGFQFI